MDNEQEKIEVYHMAYTITIEPNELTKIKKTKYSRGNVDEVRKLVGEALIKSVEPLSKKSQLHWNNFQSYDGYQCFANDNYFHVVDKVHLFDGKKLCAECIKDILKRENTEE